jgi:hypothetical protein
MPNIALVEKKRITVYYTLTRFSLIPSNDLAELWVISAAAGRNDRKKILLFKKKIRKKILRFIFT